MKHLRGMINFTNITVWALGVIATVAVASTATTNNHLGRLDEGQTAIIERVAVTETKNARYEQDIAELKAKMDALLWANGINPSKVIVTNKSVAQ